MKHALPPLLMCLAACALPPTDEEVIQEAREKVFPAVVFVKPIQQEFRGGRMEKIQSFGSGVIIDNEGHVVTNNHVAEKATGIRCVLSDREELPATVVGLDPETDVAVLKLDLSERKSKEPLPFAEFGDSRTLREGQFVMAMGAPHGLPRTVSSGIVSSTERYFDFTPYNLWIQTDAAINPGNSGGPLVDIKGRVVGINALGMRGAENLGFAIPSFVVERVVREILDHGKVRRAWTGIKFQPLNDFTKSSAIDASEGVLVAGVDEASPAEEAGLRAGDIVTALGDDRFTAMYETELPAVERRFANLEIEKPVKVLLRRGDKEVTVSLTPTSKGRHKGDDFECKRWDLTVKEITKFANTFITFQRQKGAFVQGVKPSGNARASGFFPGDILVSIGDRPIEAFVDIHKAYEASLKLEKGKRKLLVRVLRQGYLRLLVLDFEKDTEKIDE